MDTPSIAAAARRLLRSADAALVELAPASGAPRTTPFVSSHEGRPVLPAAAGLSAGAARRSALLLTAWLAAAPAAAVEVPFLEDFASEDDAATWRNATVQDVDWAASGGPDGGAHIETTLNYFGFENPFGGGPVVFRAEDEFGASGGAFEGDWLDAGVGLLGLGAIGRRRRV